MKLRITAGHLCEHKPIATQNTYDTHATYIINNLAYMLIHNYKYKIPIKEPKTQKTMSSELNKKKLVLNHK